eukprot:TRINITY_DN8740_c0_g2_i2.p1 TRINITY_DN8740_c0_g2~~TRINITY_DN8740_c0_g2_i2.p1  ORF type:complete len:266 (+),score=46.52 TRINITY_DN8740_c0_g2_i2:71-799(+)
MDTSSSPDLSKFLFRSPEKKINSVESLNKFLTSTTCNDFLQFLEDLNESVKGIPLDKECHTSPFVVGCLELIAKCSVLIDEIPPQVQPMRFGNKAFRVWHERLTQVFGTYLKDLLPEPYHPSVEEVSWYFLNSLGNTTRIDYGTGHETAFIAFLYCFKRLGLVAAEDYTALVLKVFVSYITLARKLQETYCMEPAGSHGVWSLDDYHFLIFYFGSSQLRGEPVFGKGVRVVRVFFSPFWGWS